MQAKRLFPLLLLLFLAVFHAPAVLAQDEPPSPPPIPPEWNFEGLRIEYQRVDVTIEDQVATTHIDQLFVNDNDWILEGTYLFPLPQGATVNQLTMWVDGQPIEAKILEKEEARQIYDEIVRQLRDPALLEYVGANAIQANVFPIPPHSERRIEIEYTQLLTADSGLFHFVYPQSTDLYTNRPLETQSIRVELRSDQALRAVYSPSHTVAIERDGDFRAVIGYEANNVTPEADFELFYSVSPEEIGLSLLSYKEAGEDGFFLLLAAPGVEVSEEELVARDVILVVDTSGSMAGEKMAQAQEAARYVVSQLNPRDRYNIISFSTGTRAFMPELIAPDGDGYVNFINSLEAAGGTNISLALLEAMEQVDPERPTTIIFLTDGLATEGIVETPLLLNAVQEAAPENARLFAFGVGHDVDTFLLDSLAQNHQGTTTYVRPSEAIDEAVSAFYAKISTPVLANIELDFGDIVVEQLYPQTLPGLFAGSQLVLTGRYREGGPATVTLTGEVNGRQQQFVYEDITFATEGGQPFIPRLWATRAIGHLLTQIRLNGENEELVQSVVNLSIRYGIITPYTSYLIEEDDIFSQTGRDAIIEMEVQEEPAEEAAVSGEAAFDRAATSSEMAEAEAPAALPMATISAPGAEGEAVAAVQVIGSKTFVWREGVWIDTAYNADVHEPQAITFASDAYFDLLSAAPELGQYLSLGQQVLLIHDGEAYEIVSEGGESSEVDLPVTTSGSDSDPEPVATEVTIDQPPAADQSTGSGMLCLAALPLLLGTALLLPLRRRRM